MQLKKPFGEFPKTYYLTLYPIGKIAMPEVIITIYVISLSVFLVFALQNLYLLWQVRKKNNYLPECIEFNELPFVTIQLPVYNEFYVVERLINSVTEIDYPKDKFEIQMLDDSNDQTSDIIDSIIKEKRALGFQLEHIRRGNRVGYKAGALQAGLQVCKGEFVAIFDSDFLPEKNFLKDTIKYFSGPKIGMVQTRWGHLNENYSWLTKMQAINLNGHFYIEQTARNKAGLFMNFNGTGGVWRKDCIIDAGGWENDTLTEDLDLSYRAQLKGWKFVFLKDVASPAELPAEANSFKTQQFRWSKGAIETAIKLLPLVWKAKLPLKIKINSTFHLTNNFVFFFILVTSLLNVPVLHYHKTAAYKMFFDSLAFFIISFFCSVIFYIAIKKSPQKNFLKLLMFPFVFATNMGLSLNNTRAVLEAVLGIKSEFTRTPKLKIMNKSDNWSKNKYISEIKIDPIILLETVLALYSIFGVWYAIKLGLFFVLPFHMLFAFGYSYVAFISLQHILRKQT